MSLTYHLFFRNADTKFEPSTEPTRIPGETTPSYTESPSKTTKHHQSTDQSSTAVTSELESMFAWKGPELRGGEVPLQDLETFLLGSPPEKRKELRRLCWETAIGQEIIKITVMDCVIKILCSQTRMFLCRILKYR